MAMSLFQLLDEIHHDKKKITREKSSLLLIVAMILVVIPTRYKMPFGIDYWQGAAFCVIFFVWLVKRSQKTGQQDALLVRKYMAMNHRQQAKKQIFYEGLSLLEDAGYPVDSVLGCHSPSIASDYALFLMGRGVAVDASCRTEKDDEGEELVDIRDKQKLLSPDDYSSDQEKMTEMSIHSSGNTTCH